MWNCGDQRASQKFNISLLLSREGTKNANAIFHSACIIDIRHPINYQSSTNDNDSCSCCISTGSIKWRLQITFGFTRIAMWFRTMLQSHRYETIGFDLAFFPIPNAWEEKAYQRSARIVKNNIDGLQNDDCISIKIEIFSSTAFLIYGKTKPWKLLADIFRYTIESNSLCPNRRTNEHIFLSR